MRTQLIKPGSPPPDRLEVSGDIRATLLWLTGKGGEAVKAVFRQDCPELLAALRRQGLTPLVYWCLVKAGLEGEVSPHFFNSTQNDYAHALRLSLCQEEEIFQSIQALTFSGVQVTLLKGADLRLRVYPDPATRPMTDLDFLVAPEQAGTARAVLKLLGYRPMEADPRPGYRERFLHADGYEPPPGLSLYLDLHWGIREGDGFYRLPYQDLMARSQEVRFHGLTLRVLAPEHLLIHLCLHLYGEFSQLRQALDLALVAQRLPVNWTVCAADVKRWGCAWPVSRALDLGHGLAPHLLPPPESLGLTDYRPSARERLLHARLLGPFTPYLAVLSHHPLKDWLAFAGAKLWPDPAFLEATYGRASRWRHYGQFLRKHLLRKVQGPKSKVQS